MKSYHVHILNSAMYDIKNIQQYISDSSDSLDTALRQKNRILSAINKLSVAPKIYRVRTKDAFHRDIRYLPVDNYFVVFAVYDDEQCVDVLNVIHNKRDIDSLI